MDDYVEKILIGAVRQERFCFGKPLFGQVNNIKTYLTLFYGIMKNTFFISQTIRCEYHAVE